jgi:hypothetical protein
VELGVVDHKTGIPEAGRKQAFLPSQRLGRPMLPTASATTDTSTATIGAVRTPTWRLANAMDLLLRPAAARAGYNQGRTLAGQLTEFRR